MDILKKIRIDGIDYDIGDSVEPANRNDLGGIIIGTGLWAERDGTTNILLGSNSGLKFIETIDPSDPSGIGYHSGLAIDTEWLINFIKSNLDISEDTGSTTTSTDIPNIYQTTVDISVINWDSCEYEYTDLIDVISLGAYPSYYPQDKTYIKLKNSAEDNLYLTEEIIDDNGDPIYLKIAVQENIPLEDVDKVIYLHIVSDNYELGTTAINQIPHFSYTIEQDPPIVDGNLSRTNYVSINLKELIDFYELKNPNLQFCGLSDQYETRHPLNGSDSTDL